MVFHQNLFFCHASWSAANTNRRGAAQFSTGAPTLLPRQVFGPPASQNIRVQVPRAGGQHPAGPVHQAQVEGGLGQRVKAAGAASDPV
jgi:hypothetical protein